MHQIVLFDDKPEAAALRRAHFDDHLAFLIENAAHLRDAGPIRRDAGAAVHSGFWRVEGLEAPAVHALIEADPLFVAGLRARWRLLDWMPVFRDGTATGLRP